MEIKEINKSTVWDNFFNANQSPSFLQSWEWGEFQKTLSYEVKRIGIYEKENLEAIAQIIFIKSKRGNFLFVPHGPIIKIPAFVPLSGTTAGKQNLIKALRDYLVTIAKINSCSFIRIAPIIEDSQEGRAIFKYLGFRISPVYMHAERVWVLPLEKSEDQLITEMRKTTRYLIRKAEKEAVIIERKHDQEAIDDFIKIYKETAERENFVPFSKKFIKNEFDCFNKTGNADFLTGKHNGQVLASALIIFTKSTGFYHQGASIHTKIPVTYLLQWEAIKEAKKRNCKLYNFWGVLQPGRTPKSWDGLTLFKQGFGGHQIDYLPTQDFIITPGYWLTYLYEKYLALKRGV